jgi:hypothetical protein
VIGFVGMTLLIQSGQGMSLISEFLRKIPTNPFCFYCSTIGARAQAMTFGAIRLTG